MTDGLQPQVPGRASLARPESERPEFTWDSARLRLTWANQPGIRFWGEDSLLDLTERVFSPGDETVRALAVREAEMADGDSVARMTLYPQGDPVWALAECRPQRRDDGRVQMWISLDDIEAVNDRALVRKRAGFDAAPRPMVIFDQLGKALVRNEADRRSYPAAYDDIDARYAEPGAGKRALARALAEGAFSHTAMIRATTAALRHRISLHRMRDPATGRVCVIADFTDLSDRPIGAPEQTFVTSQITATTTVSAEALARIAHDIRAPLSAISGFAEMLRLMGDTMPSDRRAGALEDIVSATSRLTQMTDRIIALGSGDGASHLGVVDLAAACADAGRLYAAQAQAAGVTLSTHAHSGPKVVADVNAIGRILDNLIQNALTHGQKRQGANGTQNGGTISVSTGGGRAGEVPWIEVSDDGPGQSPDLADAAFARYKTPNVPGFGEAPPKLHGLGLANVRALAKTMGATTTITTSPGNGFAVRVTFAVASGADKSASDISPN